MVMQALIETIALIGMLILVVKEGTEVFKELEFKNERN
jgi:hypothetical protein